jgi:hypothetical protein
MSSRDSPSAQTSSDGYFHIGHLPSGRTSVALVQNDGTRMFATQSREVEIVEGETAYVEFHSRRILLQGQVRRRGSPVPGAAIALSPASSGMGFSVSSGSRGGPPSAGPRYLSAVAGEDGYYELLVDEPGEYRVSPSANGVGFPSRTIAIPDVESLSLDLDFGGAALSGRVVDKETEAPVAGALVMVRSEDPSKRAQGTGLQVGPDGSFELELEPGEFTLVVQADGAPVGNAIVAVVAIDGRKVRGVQAVADGNGRLVLPSPRGNLTMKAALMNGPEGLATVAVSDGATARVEIAIAQTTQSVSRK